MLHESIILKEVHTRICNAPAWIMTKALTMVYRCGLKGKEMLLINVCTLECNSGRCAIQPSHIA